MKVSRNNLFVASLLALSAHALTAEELTIASFESGKEGFRNGAIVDVGNGGKCLEISNKDKGFVDTEKLLEGIEHDLQTLTFKVRLSGKGQFAVRVNDATGQSHLQRPTVKSDDAWHRVTISKFDEGNNYESWGGANDKKWHPPASSIAFVLEDSGTLCIDDVNANLRPEKIANLCRVSCPSLGNVFVQGESPSFKIETQACQTHYTVRGFTGTLLAEGDIKPVDGSVILSPEIRHRGSFTLKLNLKFNELPPLEKELDFGILRSFKGKDMSRSPFGVCTHFAQNWSVDRIELLPKYGIASIRDELYWDEVEKKAGLFNFSSYDPYMERLRQFNISPLIILSYENSLYDGGMTPCSQKGYDAFARYATEALKHYDGQIKWLDVWNEYNGSFCKGKASEDRPRYYTEMLRTAHQRIKSDRPDVTVIGAACVLIPLPYLEKLFKNEALRHMDAVAVHPYRSAPEGVERELAELKELIRTYNKGADKAIWCTEYGYGVHNAGNRANIARYLVRTSVLMSSQGVERMYWYLFADYAEFATMGLVQAHDSATGKYTPTPAGAAFANMAWLLHDAKYEAAEAVRQFAKCRVHRFSTPSGDSVRACWATYPTVLVAETDGKPIRCDLMGNESPLVVKDGQIEIPLDETPLYLIGPLKNLREKPSAETIIADSVEEFSKTQGTNNWRYGSCAAKEGTKANARDDFTEMRQVETIWGVKWAGVDEHLELSSEGGHPALSDGKPVWAVRRWKSPLSGNVILDGRVAVESMESDGVELSIWLEGKPVTRTFVRPSADKAGVFFKEEIEVRQNAIVDFCVGPGPANNLANDAFAFKVRIISETGAEGK